MTMIVAAALLAALLAWPESRAAAKVQPQAQYEPGIRVEWAVRNPFRLFRNEAHFQRHVAAHAAGGVLSAERRLAVQTDGRGWAQDMVAHLCADATGRLLDTCERDGVRESYLSPQDHPVSVRVTGAVAEGAICNWTFDDGTLPIRRASAPCTEVMSLRVTYGRATIAAAGIVRADGSVDSASAEVMVRDLLIAGIGDSVAAGEGNPDRPVALDDVGFCFRRFFGSGLSEYYRPSRAGFTGEKACPEAPSGSGGAEDWARHAALWHSAACHRSLYSYQFRAALAVAVENPHVAVTFLPLACSGATIERGLLGSQAARECPLTGDCAGSVPGQIGQLREILRLAQQRQRDRALDMLLLTVGANDIQFSGIVADVILTPSVERTLFNQGGLIATVPQAQRVLDRQLPGRFVRLRAALKSVVGKNLSRVVFVSYGNPAMRGGQACSGGRDGLDVHPAFAADPAKLRETGEFVQNRFLPALRSLARCEGGAICAEPQTDSMSFADAHQPAFAHRGFCVRSPEDPPFDRQCFSPRGESFDPNPVTAATSPLACGSRPSEFRPYASRARWIRTANDSYFTAMTFPQRMLAPANIHDATWGALSAVYGGAIHPTAEGHAAMADAAMPFARDVLGLPAPAAVTVAPLPLLPATGGR